MAPVSTSFAVVGAIIKATDWATTDGAGIWERALTDFVEGNEDPTTSTNFSDGSDDDLDCITYLLHTWDGQKGEGLLLLLLKALKILSRKGGNRLKLKGSDIAAILQQLHSPCNQQVAAEAANVLLNACYEKANVHLVIANGGLASVVRLLKDKSAEVQANVAGTLQSISFQANGRESARKAGAVVPLLHLLDSSEPRVLGRAIGALHNISADSASVTLIRQAGGIPQIVRLLRVEDWQVGGSAAGTLQNLSRQTACRVLIKDEGAVQPLVRLLCGPALQAQVCAAGALLNILGPDLERGPKGSSHRHALAQICATTMALAAVHHVVLNKCEICV